MIVNLRRVNKALLDLLFPPHCVSCRREGTYLCPACDGDIPRVIPPVCELCGQPVPVSGPCSSCLRDQQPLDGLNIRSAAFFEQALRPAIHAFKYEGIRALAESLGKILAEGWRTFRPPGEVIIPVPLHARRLRQRGYNQSALLARELSGRIGVPVLEQALVRARDTAPQVDLDARQRQVNVEGAFLCCPEQIRGRAVLLVDDVCTTGATIRACATALYPHEPASVWALTLARAR